MGYTFIKINNRKVLIEQPHLLSKTIRFLRKYQQYLETNVPSKITIFRVGVDNVLILLTV
jgi:hypothetical protein